MLNSDEKQLYIIGIDKVKYLDVYDDKFINVINIK